MFFVAYHHFHAHILTTAFEREELAVRIPKFIDDECATNLDFMPDFRFKDADGCETDLFLCVPTISLAQASIVQDSVSARSASQKRLEKLKEVAEQALRDETADADAAVRQII